ncbi:MAG: YicC family protein [Planctomycetes bacterium]|nr:YicC family protein [Planctomycetota bacterium]
MAALRSMTGFGAATSSEAQVQVRVEVRSVNHRFLQLKVKLPPELASFEGEVEAAVRKVLERGSVSLSVSVDAGGGSTVRIDRELAQRYMTEVESLAKELGLEGRPKLETILALPGVVGSQSDPKLAEREARLLRGAVRDGLAELVAMREREGAALLQDLRANTAALTKEAARIEKRMPKVVKEHHKKLRTRMQDLLGGGIKLGPAELPRELALLADRMDVGEELARLSSHLVQWSALLEKGGATGRQLDFLVQELLREANTIGSKCNDAEVAHSVVEVKTRIERLREQVQNVE